MAGVGMLRRADNQKRLQRCKKIPRRIAHTRLRRTILAEFSAQHGDDIRGARYLGAAVFQPLELGQKIGARQRLQPLQIILDRIRPFHCTKSSRKLIGITRARRAQA
jgi:hypothetical protein